MALGVWEGPGGVGGWEGVGSWGGMKGAGGFGEVHGGARGLSPVNNLVVMQELQPQDNARSIKPGGRGSQLGLKRTPPPQP